MANYNSRIKYNSGFLYNDRISHVAVGGSISLSGSITRKASLFRQFLSNISSVGSISRRKYGTVGRGNVAIATSIGRKIYRKIYSDLTAISGAITRVSTYFRFGGNGNVNISGGMSKSAMFARNVFCNVNLSAILNRAGFFKRVFGDNHATMSSYISRRTSKTVSNGIADTLGTITKNMTKQFRSSISSSSIVNVRPIFHRLLTGEVSISQALSKKISKSIFGNINIQSSFNRASTFFRDVGHQFYYNMGITYNTPIERNGNVGISGNMSNAAFFIRNLISGINISSVLSRIGFFNRLAGNDEVALTSSIRKISLKYISHEIAEITGSIVKQSKKHISASINISSMIDKVSQFYRTFHANIALTKEFSKMLGKNLYASISIESSFNKIGKFYRNITSNTLLSGGVTKQLSKEFTRILTCSGSVVKSVSKYFADVVITDSSICLSTLKNIYRSIDITGTLSKVASFYRTFTKQVFPSSVLTTTSNFVRNIGNGAVNAVSSISKVISKSIFSTVYISMDAMQFVGSGIVSIASALSKFKYHFLVTLDGILLPLGVKVLRDSSVDIVPSVKDYTEEIPGRHGEISFKTEFGSRAIELHVAKEMSPEEREKLKQQYAKHIISEDTKTLVFESDIDKSYEVKYAGKIDPNQYPLHMDFAIPFKMTKPFIDGSYEKELTGSGVIANDGTVETSLIIEIKGQVTNPTVVIGDDTISYNGSLSNEQTLIIDTEKQTAKIGSVNVIDKFSGDFKALQPGKVNVIADNNVTIRWRDRWL